MSTVFVETLKPLITISKLTGFISFCYTFENGFLYRDITSKYKLYFEMIWLFWFLLCTASIFSRSGKFSVLQIDLIKHWVIILVARISEEWIIKFINGVIEFDRKLLVLNTSIKINYLSLFSKTFWTAIFIVIFIYFTVFQIYFIYITPEIRFYNILITLVHTPSLIMFVVMISSCLNLCYLGYKFCVLNNLWSSLPTGLIASPAGWTNYEITVLVGSIQLLHAELSDLFRVFSLGYVFKTNSIEIGWVPLILFVQNIILIVSVLYTATWAIEKKKKIISYLRLNPIANMSVDTKLQIFMFMNQISVYESTELTAFGVFNLNLKLVISMLVFMITTFATLIQMKEQQFVIDLSHIIFKSLIKSKL